MAKTSYRVTVGNEVKTVHTIPEVCQLLGVDPLAIKKSDVVKGKVPGVVATLVNTADVSQDKTWDQVLAEGDAAATQEPHTEDPAQDIPEDLQPTGDYDPNTDPDYAGEDTQDDVANLPSEADATDEPVDSDTQESTDEAEDTQAPTNRGVNPELLAKLRAMSAEKLAKAGKGKGKKGATQEEEVTYPERGSVKSEKDLKKFYKKLTDAQLDEWMELEGVTYKPCEHEAINRMRKCMAITAVYFPKPVSASKSKSVYADFTTEQLAEMAVENDIAIRDDKGDPRILRMYLIMALREHGLLPASK